MRARSIRIGASWLAAAVLLAAPVRAQVITADIEGVVTDSSGAAISGATVTARNAGTGFERVATSTARGLTALWRRDALT